MAIKFLSTVAVDTNVLYVDAAANKVGIGTASPSAKLQVTGTSGYVLKTNGDIALTTYTGDTKIDMANNSLQLLSPSGNVQIGDTEFDGNGTSIQVDDANSKVVIAGNVGIGTSTPGKLLEVKSSIAYNSTVRLSTTAHNWDIQGGETGYSSTAFALDYDGTTFFRAMGTTDARFSGGLSVGTINATPPTGGLYVAGNVGIGTTSPGEKLDVAGSVKTTGTVKFYNSTSHYGSIYADSEGLNLDTVANRHMIFKKANVEVMRISTSGNVGIGTTSPLNKLQVSDGSVGIDSQYMIRDNRNNTILQQSANTAASNRSLTIGNATYSNVIIPNGNVGIGTTSPSAKLEVSGDLRISSDQTSLIKISNESNEDYFTVSQSTNNKPTLSLGDIDEQYGTLLTVDVESEEVVIFTNGTVKIGDNGFGNSTQFIVDDVNQKFTFTNGDVGIGVTTPRAKLDVAGGIKVADDTDTAVANKEGTLRYRLAPSSPKSQSMVDMCMKTGPSSYAWVNIVTNTWSN